MATRSLGALTLDLIARIGGFEKGLDQAGRVLDKQGRAMEARARRIGYGIGAALAAGFAVLGTVAFTVKQTIDSMDELSKASQKVGQSTEDFSRLAYAGELADVSVDQLVTTMGRLTKAQLAAEDSTSSQAKIFKALGISVKDAEGNLRESNELLLDFADRFQQLGGSQEAIGAGIELFGKSFQQMIPLLKDGSAGLREAFEESDRLGRTLSTEAGESAEQFNDNLTRLKAAAQGLAIEFTSGLLPGLEDASNNLVQYAQEAREGESVTEDLGRAVGDMASDFSEAIPEISKFVRFMLESRNVIAYAADSLAAKSADALANLIPSEQAQDFLRQNAEDARRRAATVGMPDADRVVTIPGVQVMGNLNEFIKQEAEARKRAAEIEQRIRDAMGKEDKAKKAGKTDAEREAERIVKTYESLNERLAETQALFGKTEEAASVRYQVEQEDLSSLDAKTKEYVQTLQAQAIASAELIDQMKLEEELSKAAKKRVEEETKAFEDQQEHVEKFIDDLKFEIELLGLSNIEREKAIALRHANVEAMSAEGQEISGLVEKYEEASESAAFMEDTQQDLADSFADFITGAKSASEAFGDFADYLFQRSAQLLADKAIDALFGAFSGTGGTGGGWGGFFKSLFGGGKASGGFASPNTLYEVNERGFEMATVGGRDYMLTGSQPVQITPHDRLSMGSSTVNNFTFLEPASPKTQAQVASKVSYEQRRAQRLSR